MFIDIPTLTAQLPIIDPSRFVALCNDLLIQNAIRMGVSRDCFNLSLLITDPDGGIDARCLNASNVGGRLLPRASCAYQFKGGNTNKTASLLAREDISDKPRIKEALAAGHAIIFLIARDHGDRFEEDVINKARELGIAVQPGQIVVISGATLAALIQALPAVASRLLNLDIEALRFEDWAGQENLRNDYKIDEGLNGRLEELRARLKVTKARVRIVGSAGDGKTRTVLEAIRGTDMQAITFYASQVNEIPNPLLEFLRRTPDSRCLLVVDEVNDDQAEQLINKCGTLPDGVGLVLIGLDASGRPQRETLQVEGLNEDLMKQIIVSIAPGLPEDVAREIAQSCERSPKLAVLIASRIREDPSLVSQSLRLADRTIQSALNRYLPLESDDFKALSGAALLMRLGWIDDAEQESVILYTALGFDPIDSRARVQTLHERYGIAPLAGRFRYISPDILGDHLAASHIKGWTGDKFKIFMAQLPPPMAKSFTQRIRRLSAVISNREAVEEAVFGDRGPFRSLEELDRTDLAHLLKNLAGVFPHAVLRTLDRLVNAASITELKAADKSRRELVWTLEELLWREDTFEKAASVLLRLAIAENETWGNSATGIWTETFQTMLGRTAAGLTPRMRVLKSAMQHEESEARRLAAVALEHSLRTGDIVRGAIPPTDVPGMPEHEWRPATFGEWSNAIIEYLSLVSQLLTDESYAVRMAAVQALAEATDAAIGFYRVLPKWLEVARLLIDSDFDLRAKILRAVELEIDRYQANREEIESTREDGTSKEKAESQKRIAENIKQLEEFMVELLGSSFSSRLRWAGTQDRWRHYLKDKDEAETKRRNRLELLAREILTTPALIDQEWKWLLTCTDNFPEEFVEILGRMDTKRSLARMIKLIADTESRGIAWLSLYEIGNAQSSDDPKLIDARLTELHRQGAKPEQIFDLLWRSGHNQFRWELLLELFASKAIPGSYIDRLIWSSWSKALSPEQVVTLLGTVTDDPSANDSAISFLSTYLHNKPDAVRELSETALYFLNQERATKDREIRRDMKDYYWNELAERLVKMAPYEVAKAAIKEMAARRSSLEGDLAKIFATAWGIGNKDRMFREILSPWFDAHTSEAWWIRKVIKRFPLEEVGIEELAQWISENPEVRVRTVAEIVGAPVGRPSDLHVMLLERFGDQNPGNIFFGSFISGAWSGPASKRTQGKLEEAKIWLEDERPIIRDWSKTVVKSLEEILKRDLKSEEEERFRWQ